MCGSLYYGVTEEAYGISDLAEWLGFPDWQGQLES
jgi:hypothetical protein